MLTGGVYDQLHEVRFPDNIAYGARGGPEFATTVVATGSGHEKRNVDWSEARGHTACTFL
jgi:uncharacterized protein (TIGR02217 family)